MKMGMALVALWVGLAVLVGATPAKAAAISASELVARSERQTRGKSFTGTVTMKVHRDDKDRELRMKIWSEGDDKALVKILAPAKDKDSGNLRLNLNLWQFLPKVDRVIKIPTSMMLQSWMGSDFTNDDLVKSSSLSRDYKHQLLGTESQGGFEIAKIQCVPHPTAPVTWGKVISWIRTKDAVPMKQEFYDEAGKLLKTMEGSNVKTFGDHTVPTHMTMRETGKANAWTTLIYEQVAFDVAIDARVFTQQNLKRMSN